MFISLAAYIDPKDFKWYVYDSPVSAKYEHPKNKRNRKHNLVIKKGDVFGVRQKRVRNSWALVKEDAMHIVFTMTDDDIDTIFERSKKHTKVPAKKTGTPPRLRTKTTGFPQRFKVKRVSAREEKKQIDKQNYQWRKIIDSDITLKSPKGKERKMTLTKNQIVGIRFVNTLKGGFVVTESGIRTRIDTKTYDKIMDESYVLDPQPKGLIVVDPEAIRLDKAREEQKKKLLAKPKSSRIKKRQDIKEQEKPSGVRKNIKNPTPIVEDEELDISVPAVKRKITKKQKEVDIEKILDEAEFEEEYKDKEAKDIVKRHEQRFSAPKRKIGPNIKKRLKEDVEQHNDLDVGDVIIFNKDKKQREYLIIDEKPSKVSSKIREYVIYNLKEKPKYLQTFRQSPTKVDLKNLTSKVRVEKQMKKYKELLLTLNISTKSPYS